MPTATNVSTLQDSAFSIVLFDDLLYEPGCNFGCVITPPRAPTVAETGPGAVILAQGAITSAAGGGDRNALGRFGVRMKGKNPAPQLTAMSSAGQYGVGPTMIRALDAGLVALLFLGFNPADHLLACDVQNAWLAWQNAGGDTGAGGLLRSIGFTLPATMRVG
jgi:hypothetical protein